jgi:hypothetical protein
MTNGMKRDLGKNSRFDFAGHAVIQNQTTADRNYPTGYDAPVNTQIQPFALDAFSF